LHRVMMCDCRNYRRHHNHLLLRRGRPNSLLLHLLHCGARVTERSDKAVVAMRASDTMLLPECTAAVLVNNPTARKPGSNTATGSKHGDPSNYRGQRRKRPMSTARARAVTSQPRRAAGKSRGHGSVSARRTKERVAKKIAVARRLTAVAKTGAEIVMKRVYIAGVVKRQRIAAEATGDAVVVVVVAVVVIVVVVVVVVVSVGVGGVGVVWVLLIHLAWRSEPLDEANCASLSLLYTV